jgi:hypothetical protein
MRYQSLVPGREPSPRAAEHSTRRLEFVHSAGAARLGVRQQELLPFLACRLRRSVLVSSR